MAWQLKATFPFFGRQRDLPPASIDQPLPGEPPPRSTEIGRRPTPEDQVKYLYRVMWVDPDLRAAIQDIRDMDRKDGRVKRIHARIGRDTIKGGLVLQQAEQSPVLGRHWAAFERRLQLNRVEKMKSDARGLVVEGNLPMQWVLDADYTLAAAVRMPADTILPNIDERGRYKDLQRAHIQFDVMTGTELAAFPLWQLLLGRFDPDNFDDLGCLGRPFLDAARTTWRKLTMTEEDLVVRRRVRAPLRLAHTLEGATPEDIAAYRSMIERDQYQITTDYYLNRKGGVQAIQGDAELDQIADVVHLLESFFAGTPLPRGLMGYSEGLARDVLEDLKRDYYDEIDSLQDTLAGIYEQGFRLQLLLHGINPDAEAFTLRFAERRTETPNQVADRALKWQALGLPRGMVWEDMGLDPSYVRERLEFERREWDPYPEPGNIGAPGQPRVSITPSNARKGESGTAISNA